MLSAKRAGLPDRLAEEFGLTGTVKHAGYQITGK
jgi:hypothetical protein